MNRAVTRLNKQTLDLIHENSLDLLNNCGIRFISDRVCDEFKKHGHRVDGQTVFFTEKDIRSALETVPDAFTFHSRNPEKSITVGGDGYVTAPGYGPPFVVDPDGVMRDALLEDVKRFSMLVQTSACLDFNSAIVVQPNDVPAETAHLDLLLAALTLTDKPVMASTVSAKAARDSLDMAKMIWGSAGRTDVDRPVMMGLVDSLAPLQYSAESAEALMVMAKAGQPVIIHSACSLGSTGPITTAGSLVVSNAANLAGIRLAQLMLPGAPVVYGLGGSPTDMRTGGYINATPEDARSTAMAGTFGRYYNIPSRGQGALTDTFSLDYQAGMESAMMLTAAAMGDVNVGIHACGTYGSMIAMSYEKFIADEDLCASVQKMIRPMEISDEAFAMDLIKEVGFTDTYLTKMHTLKRCRDEFFLPTLNRRMPHAKWRRRDEDITARATRLVKERLAAYTKPDMDAGLEKDLMKFVEKAKGK